MLPRQGPHLVVPRVPVVGKTVEQQRFDKKQLNVMKETCQTHCFSTLNHNLAYCYKASRAIKWTLKQALRGFQGTTGSFEE